MPAALIPNELSKPLSLRIEQTTNDDLRECAEASNMKIGEISRLLLDGSLEMLRRAHDSEGNRLPEIELPKPLERIAKAQEQGLPHGVVRGPKWLLKEASRSVRDMAEDNSKMIKALGQEVETLRKLLTSP
jgi:hypothetical protein